MLGVFTLIVLLFWQLGADLAGAGHCKFRHRPTVLVWRKRFTMSCMFRHTRELTVDITVPE